MPRARAAPESEETNGRNGAGVVRQAALVSWDSTVSRRTVVIQAVFGSITDARVIFFSVPGSTVDGWNYFERIIEPLRRFVVDGDPPWVQPRTLTVEQQEVMARGVPTPEGDCAEDAMPLELRNPYRAEAKGNGEKS